MPRENKTAAEITAEIESLVNADERVRVDGITLKGPAPTQWAEPDGTGCNWTVISPGATQGHDDAMTRAIETVRAKWNLIV